MVKVTKKEFYAMIAPLERLDTGATIHHYPEKMSRWRVRQWQNGEHKEVAYIETFISRRYPFPECHYVDESLIKQLIVFEDTQ